MKKLISIKAPFRISLFGGGSDFPKWFNNYGGAVISGSIDKYCTITIRKLPSFFFHKHRIVWSKIELVNQIDEISHPVIKEVLKSFNFSEGLEIHHFGDLPARSGIGSSSSFSVALLKAIHELKGIKIEKDRIIDQSIKLERNKLKEMGGWQDQIIVTKGGFRYTEFSYKNSYVSTKIKISDKCLNELNNQLLLFYTGNPRSSYIIQNKLQKNILNKKSELNDICSITKEALKIILSKKNYILLGSLLDESWKIKKCLHKEISNSYLDDLYSYAQKNGAIGGKLLGAGQGGFLLLFVTDLQKANLIKKMEKKKIINVPFKFEDKGLHRVKL